MTDNEDIDALAAEYVLGSLEPAERKAVNERLGHEAALREAIAAWERRLAPLSERVPGVAPPPDLYGKIVSQIRSATDRRQDHALVRRRYDRRTILVRGTLALAACLLLGLGTLLYLGTRDPDLLVAQLHRTNAQGTADESHLPAFAVVVEPGKGVLSVRPIAVRPTPGKGYALWLVRQPGTSPIFLGIVSPSAVTTLPWSATGHLREYVNAGLMITFESQGTSGAQSPTGDVMFSGTLVGADG